MDSSINMNKYYVSITSVLVLIFKGCSIYFLALVFRFKNKVLSFYSELDPLSTQASEKSAREFYLYLVSDEKEALDSSKKTLEEYH